MLRRAVKTGTWTLLGALLLAVAAFYLAIGVEHVNPPVVAVQGSSMRPVLSNGDLVVLQGVPPAALRKGDVIAIAVPAALQARDHLPPDIEHRIVGIEHTAYGIRFTTKGDANPRPDPFEVRPSEIVGKVTGSIPLLGYVFLFFGSVPGDVFLALLAVGAAAYFLVRWWTRRRACVRRLAGTIEALRVDADEIRTALTSGGGFPVAAAAASAPEQGSESEELDRAVSALEELVTEVRTTSDESRDSAAMLRELVGAVSEYGEHLRSHTAVMRNLAATTDQLQEAAARLANAVTSPATRLRPLASERGIGASGRLPAPTEPPRVPREHEERYAHRSAIDEELWREPFTAVELRWPNLPRRDDGYVAEPVDRLLDRAADALDLVERERNSLRERLLVVETRLAILTEQEKSSVQTRLAAQRDAQELDARARHDATLALQEASRRAADIVHDIEEERNKLLGLARELGEQLRGAGNRHGDEAATRATPEPPSAGPSGVASPPGRPGALAAALPAPPPASAPASPAPWTPATTPAPARAGATPSPSATSDQLSSAPSQDNGTHRREPPDVPPVWDVTPHPTR